MSKKFLILFFFITAVLSAQVNRDSLSFFLSSYKNKVLSSVFDKQLNTYNLNSLLNYNINSQKFFIGVSEEFRSTIVKSNTKNIKDEQYLSLIGEYNLSQSLKLGGLVNNNIYSDDRSLAFNKTSNLHTTLFAKYNPAKELNFIPFFGYSENNQVGERDKGIIYGTDALLEGYSIDEFNFQSSFKLQNEDIAPRKNTLRSINLNISNIFEDSFINFVSGSHSQQRRDFYFEADSIIARQFNVTNNIQSRTETNYFLQDRIFYSTGISGLGFELIGRVSWRDIDRATRYASLININSSSFDSKIEELKLDFSGSAQYSMEDFSGQFRFAHSEREEKHSAKNIEGADVLLFEDRQDIESRKNNKSLQTTVSISGNFKITPDDNLSISIFHRKLQYDTQHSENYDDRDELLSIFRIYYAKNLSPLFTLFANVEGSINKTVYIFAERSSNNNIRRVLKLAGGGIYSGRYFTSSNSAEVSANYTVYDYEDLNPNYRSFSFRQLAVRDSSSLKITSTTALNFFGYLKLSEQGDFKWSNFTGKPVRFIEEIYLEPKLNYYIGKLKFGAGLRYFALTNFNYNNSNKKIIDSDYESIGPLAEVGMNVNDSLQLNIYGWYEFITSRNGGEREMANLNLKFNWNL